MPTSAPDFKIHIREYLFTKDKDLAVLDVGPGEGTYSDLLRGHFKNIDCIEIWKPYVSRYKLRRKYREVIVGDVRKFDGFDKYELVIFGDVLEHLHIDEAQLVLSKVKCEVLVSIPYMCGDPTADPETYDHEFHYQYDLTDETMSERYPDLKLIWASKRIGIYMKNA